MTTSVIEIAKEFSPAPAGRYVEDGPFSAQRFREEFLVPKLHDAINNNSILEVSLDGLLGVSSSFLEEAFGGLVRSRVFTPEQLAKHLLLAEHGGAYAWAILDARKYMAEASTKH